MSIIPSQDKIGLTRIKMTLAVKYLVTFLVHDAILPELIE